MDAELSRQIIERVLSLLANKTTDMAESGSSLPVKRYIDPQPLAREQSILFRRHPLPLGHTSVLAAPGDFLPDDATGVPFLLHRGEDGQLRGFLNGSSVCAESFPVAAGPRQAPR